MVIVWWFGNPRWYRPQPVAGHRILYRQQPTLLVLAKDCRATNTRSSLIIRLTHTITLATLLRAEQSITAQRQRTGRRSMLLKPLRISVSGR
jgi:hypothetical protein